MINHEMKSKPFFLELRVFRGYTFLLLFLLLFVLPAHAQRITANTENLPVISGEQRQWLADNPEGLTPAELNDRAPEMNAVEVMNTHPVPEAEGPIRVVAWNMERGRNWQDGVTLLAGHDALRNADVLLLTEMDIGMARSGNVNTTREVAHALGMNYAYAVEFLELSLGKLDDLTTVSAPENTVGYHGNAILCRYPLENVRAVRFPGIERWYRSDENRLGGRCAVFAEAVIRGTRTLLVVTHLESALTASDARDREVGLILKEIEEHGGGLPVILGGDLNAMHKNQCIQMLRDAGFAVDDANDLKTSTSQAVKDGKVRLFGAHIDYIAPRGFSISPELPPAVVMSTWPNTPEGRELSDHAVVAVDLHPPLTESSQP